jgi:hypothetical protein
MIKYKVGDWLINLQSRQMFKIIRVLPAGRGGGQVLVENLDNKRLKPFWANYLKLNKNYSNSKMAQVLYTNTITKAVQDETNG